MPSPRTRNASLTSWPLLLAVCAGSGFAHICTSAMPFQIGVLMDGAHRSASEAGLFGFCQIGALALSMVAISRHIDRLAPRWVAVVGCALAFGANLGLYATNVFALQLVLAIASGGGFGFVFAATVAGAAQHPLPDRIYAIGNGGALLIIVGLMSLLPSAASHFGPMGLFAVLAALSMLSAPALLGFGPAAARSATQSRFWRTPGARGLLFAWFVYAMSNASVYAFSERIGIRLGLGSAQIAFALSSGVFVGVFGTLVAALAAGRVPRALALTVSLLGTGCGCLLLGLSFDFVSYVAGVYLYWTFNMFLYSYLLGTAAVLDVSGRIGTFGGGLERLGFALGTALGGLVTDHGSVTWTGVLAFTGCLIAAAGGFPSLFRALRAPSQATLS